MTAAMKNTAALILLFAACQVLPADASVRNFFAPQWQGARLDSCLSGKTSCGKPVADAFCKAEGFDTAILFQREPGLLTRQIESSQRCEGAACTSFKQIKCYSAKSDLAAVIQN